MQEKDYQHKNAVVAEQGRWLLDQGAKAITTNLHEGFLCGTKMNRWAQAMAGLTTGVVIH
jgi:hypothetical protein